MASDWNLYLLVLTFITVLIGEPKDKITTSRSLFSASRNSKENHVDSAWKSDMDIPRETKRPTNQDAKSKYLKDESREYYKRYEHDEMPVKDFVNSNSIIGTGDSERIASLTSSLLDRLEHKVLKKYESQELQTDGSSFESLDSHIKIFQTTVKEIFDTFYTNMRDYEGYKKRYNEILEKNKADTVIEMERFIKDMIQHIVSADPSNTSISSNLTYDLKDAEIKTEALENTKCDGAMLEAYKNTYFICDSITEENLSSNKHSTKSGEVFNIYLMSTSPSIEIKVNDRNMSEINIKDQKPPVDSKIASADNLRRKSVIRKDTEEENEDLRSDREIPIKSSCPKKNIYLNEDFQYEHEKTERSFLSRLCSYFCKRFRK